MLVLEPGTRILVSGHLVAAKALCSALSVGFGLTAAGHFLYLEVGVCYFSPKRIIFLRPVARCCRFRSGNNTDDDPHICEALKDCAVSPVDTLDDRRNWAQQLYQVNSNASPSCAPDRSVLNGSF